MYFILDMQQKTIQTLTIKTNSDNNNKYEDHNSS